MSRVAVGSPAGHITGNGYLRIAICDRKFYAHRLAWYLTHGEWPVGEIDHINGIRTDNRIANLRDVPKYINAQNLRKAKRSNATSGLLGVTRKRDRTNWVAQISVGRTCRHLGSFADKESAHQAYLAAKLAMHEGCVLRLAPRDGKSRSAAE